MSYLGSIILRKVTKFDNRSFDKGKKKFEDKRGKYGKQVFTAEMRRVVGWIVLLLTVCSVSLAKVNPGWAADLGNGAAVFSANCAACHMGGKNVVNAAKTLQKEDLQKYDMYDIEKIKYQVIHGKAAMPAFGGRLTAEQIEDVAAYVLAQADKGWK